MRRGPLFAAALMPLVLLATPSRAAEEPASLKSTLTLNQDLYEAGMPIRGELTVVNEGSGWAEIPDASHLARHLELRLGGGKVVKAQDPDRFGAAKTTALGPGGFVGFDFDARALFPLLEKPGEYLLAFAPPGALPAATVSLRILPAFDPNEDYRLSLTTPVGELVIDLFEKEAPVAVHNIVQLARTGFFDGAAIPKIQKGVALVIRGPITERHRIVPFEKTTAPLLAGTVVLEPAPPGRRRPGNFPKLIVLLGPQPDWQGKSTAVGQVVAGQEVLEKLSQVPTTGARSRTPFRPLRPLAVERAEVRVAEPASAD